VSAADVASPDSLAKAAQMAAAHLGDISGWVNNAGIVQMMPAKDVSPDAFAREFEINVAGVMYGAQTAYRVFAGKGGAIVNIASNAGQSGLPEHGRLQCNEGGGDQSHPFAGARMGG
jgi:meso-butanediol dehydrogenase/(S,S)-butanediol dehydrogenase/diacetyl reductase